MSPEVAHRENYKTDIDVWTLGVLLYELTHGYTPFYSSSKDEILDNIKYKEINFKSSCPKDLQDLLRNILKKPLSDRFDIA